MTILIFISLLLLWATSLDLLNHITVFAVELENHVSSVLIEIWAFQEDASIFQLNCQFSQSGFSDTSNVDMISLTMCPLLALSAKV